MRLQSNELGEPGVWDDVRSGANPTRIKELLRGLLHADDPMPDGLCSDLGLPKGSSFGQGARKAYRRAHVALGPWGHLLQEEGFQDESATSDIPPIVIASAERRRAWTEADPRELFALMTMERDWEDEDATAASAFFTPGTMQEILRALWYSVESMPEEVCEELELPAGSTYSQGSREACRLAIRAILSAVAQLTHVLRDLEDLDIRGPGSGLPPASYPDS